MQITRGTDYAVRVMIHLAGLPLGIRVRQSELSKASDVSGHFLSKVLQQLVRSRLVASQRGSGGGYALAVPATSISLLDVVEAVEGPVRLNLCLAEGQSCERKSWCPAHLVWAEAQGAALNILGAASLASLASQVAAHSALSTACMKKTGLDLRSAQEAGCETLPEGGLRASQLP